MRPAWWWWRSSRPDAPFCRRGDGRAGPGGAGACDGCCAAAVKCRGNGPFGSTRRRRRLVHDANDNHNTMAADDGQLCTAPAPGTAKKERGQGRDRDRDRDGPYDGESTFQLQAACTQPLHPACAQLAPSSHPAWPVSAPSHPSATAGGGPRPMGCSRRCKARGAGCVVVFLPPCMTWLGMQEPTVPWRMCGIAHPSAVCYV